MTITLSDEAAAMRAGAYGEARRLAIEHQIAVGRFFDAPDFVPVTGLIATGDDLALDPAAGTVTVLARAAER